MYSAICILRQPLGMAKWILSHDYSLRCNTYIERGCVEICDFHTAGVSRSFKYLIFLFIKNTGRGIKARTHAHMEIKHFWKGCLAGTSTSFRNVQYLQEPGFLLYTYAGNYRCSLKLVPLSVNHKTAIENYRPWWSRFHISKCGFYGWIALYTILIWFCNMQLVSSTDSSKKPCLTFCLGVPVINVSRVLCHVFWFAYIFISGKEVVCT